MEKLIKSITNAKADSFSSLSDLNSDLRIQVELGEKTFPTQNSIIQITQPLTNEVELLEQRTKKNGTEGLECELLIDQGIDQVYEVDVTGCIILSCEDEENYFIDTNAELNFNFE